MDSPNNRSLFEYFSPLVFRVLDFCTIFLAFYAAHWFRFNHIKVTFEYEILTLLSSFIVVTCVSSFGAYASWRGKNRIEMLGRIIAAWSFAFLCVLGLLVLSKKGEDFSRLWLGYAYVSSLVFTILLRITLYSLLSFLRRLGFNQKKVILIGNQKSVENIRSLIRQERSSGFEIFSAMNKQLASVFGKDLSIGNLDELERVLLKNNIPEIWFCLSLKDSEFLDKALFALRHSTVNVRYVPDMSGFRLLNHQITNVAGIPTIDLSSSPLHGANALLKRLEDLVIALGIIIVISPVLVVVAFAIRFTSKGPILFKQLRHGADGKPINIYKFRTMFLHDDNGEVKQAIKNDSRVTPLGNFLRRTSLDELPQFYNVLQGRMSVVGPRPHAIAHNEHYKELVASYMKRHKVKPGITGWAQVNGLRGETDTIEKMEKRVEFDLYYIDNWSLSFDIKIVFMTIFKGFSGENVY
jgi:putative colanic acid biosynthesis UDP-glucose lipid carrier transferase